MHHYLGAISTKIKHSSSMKAVHRKMSADSCFGRRPKSKSDELFLCTASLVEIQRCEDSTFTIHTALIRSLTLSYMRPAAYGSVIWFAHIAPCPPDRWASLARSAGILACACPLHARCILGISLVPGCLAMSRCEGLRLHAPPPFRCPRLNVMCRLGSLGPP